MKSYSILIVGIKCYFGHIYEFASNLKKKNPLVKITLFTTPLSDEFKERLTNFVDHIVEYKPIRRKSIPRPIVSSLNILLCNLRLIRLRRQCHFDIVDIHFATPFIRHSMHTLKSMAGRIVISPWGSDVMRVENPKAVRDLRKVYSSAHFVTVPPQSQVGQAVIEQFGVDIQKMANLSWGGEFFDYIQEHAQNINVDEAKARFGLKDRYVITCGYNTQQSQRHVEIINAVARIKDQLPENLTLLIPCTYVFYREASAHKDDYINSLRKQCDSLGLDLFILKEHLDMDDLLKLRMATDIFVHVQTTDAGSRSVMEYFACNKRVVHGSWIEYPYLKEYKPSCYFPVDRIEDLDSVLVRASQSPVTELPQGLKTVIYERGWNHKMGQWNAFFESLVSE